MYFCTHNEFRRGFIIETELKATQARLRRDCEKNIRREVTNLKSGERTCAVKNKCASSRWCIRRYSNAR